ncbi:hypothetical protein DPMN_062613 [Dreissena polymorpha]|uniref:Uncharacterized protein n=1 Tax=Dreissena polymorpha TaxID=45954 RepID=A0A9D4C915_DREPO|nr:hypothetical protein DPMN_062613 [Dreissena polymorpha]
MATRRQLKAWNSCTRAGFIVWSGADNRKNFWNLVRSERTGEVAAKAICKYPGKCSQIRYDTKFALKQNV